MQTMQLDQVHQTVSLMMDVNESPQYRWGNVQVIGLDPNLEGILRSRVTVGSPASPKLMRDFYREYKSLLPTGASPETVKWQPDAKRAIVDLTFEFSTPPAPPVHD
jgi:hypothetical protein